MNRGRLKDGGEVSCKAGKLSRRPVYGRGILKALQNNMAGSSPFFEKAQKLGIKDAADAIEADTHSHGAFLQRRTYLPVWHKLNNTYL